MQQGVVLLDADLKVLVFNARAAELLQAPKGAIEIGLSAAKIAARIPALAQPPGPDDGEDNWLTHLLTRSSLLYQEISIGDRAISVTSTPLEGAGWLVSCDDVSVLTSLKTDLAAQNSRFESALANMPHGLCMFDAEKRLLLCNAAYARLYDLPETLTRPGTPLSQILDYRRTAGNEPVQQEAYFDVVVEAALKGSAASQNIPLSDGRVIKITHNPMEHGATSPLMRIAPRPCAPKSR
jgi:PAS domain-containing protein